SEAISTARPTRHRGRPSYGEASPASPTSSKEPASQRRHQTLMGNCKGEKGYTVALAAHAGASMIHECAGMHGSLMGTCFESYVLDNDLLGAILRTVKGVEVTGDALSFDVIRDVVLGEGHYLGHPQTFSRMKTDYLYPAIADRRSISVWEETGARDAREVARDTVQTVLGEHYPTHIDPAIDRQLRDNFNIILPAARMRPGNGVW
ncbi:MAG: trimethylamine methyltransferase family protein, partial [Pseudodonghicola sp.]|nr:trimethylamine methyltransferase family protein [Pseudodonghicola sp.]